MSNDVLANLRDKHDVPQAHADLTAPIITHATKYRPYASEHAAPNKPKLQQRQLSPTEARAQEDEPFLKVASFLNNRSIIQLSRFLHIGAMTKLLRSRFHSEVLPRGLRHNYYRKTHPCPSLSAFKLKHSRGRSLFANIGS